MSTFLLLFLAIFPYYRQRILLPKPRNAKEEYARAFAYGNGTGVVKNNTKCFFWMKQSAKHGYARAALMLSFMYLDGFGTRADKSQALYWLRKAARHHNAPAQTDLGFDYKHGIGVEPNWQRTLYWYRKAAKSGYARAQYQLGWLYWPPGNGRKANLKKAVFWWKKAAHQGYQAAEFELVSPYLFGGPGIKPNLAKATVWAFKAAMPHPPQPDSEDEAALNLAGQLYVSGIGVARNYLKAYSYWRKEDALHPIVPNDQLCILYEYGLGTGQNDARAAQCYLKAIKINQRDSFCKMRLGLLYLQGRGVRRNYLKAANLFMHSSDNPVSDYELGKMNEHGQLFSDLADAVSYYRQAALKGYIQAELKLSQMYGRGLEVKKSSSRAYAWLLVAQNTERQKLERIHHYQTDEAFRAAINLCYLALPGSRFMPIQNPSYGIHVMHAQCPIGNWREFLPPVVQPLFRLQAEIQTRLKPMELELTAVDLNAGQKYAANIMQKMKSKKQ